MPEKIVLVTAGGHISCFHAGMKAMYERLEERAPGKFELMGAFGGLSALADGRLVPIRYEDIDENKAGSLICADRKVVSTVKTARSTKNNDIYAVVMMGGDNHLGEAEKLHKGQMKLQDVEELINADQSITPEDKQREIESLLATRINTVGYPKTMDGDLSTYLTLGYHTAVTVAAEQTRNHHASAMTNKRVFYVGLFGRNTDWTVAGVTAFGGGDLGIPCEKGQKDEKERYSIEFILDKVADAVKMNKEKYGIGFAIVPYSEGAMINGVDEPPKNHCSYDAHGNPKLQPEWLGLELVRLSKDRDISAAFQAHTYDMRDSPPTEVDKELSALAGRECMDMVIEGDFGKCATFQPSGDKIIPTRTLLSIVSKQKPMMPTGFFDYNTLTPTQAFIDSYGDIFRNLTEGPMAKDDLVYKNLRRK